ncbi:hypothetical protein [Kordiimonas aquimaris]|uniref:hypothetical protein n=1 Tax=Kordiimonas aquimaris TaxID=707591 RepID=UPI0021D31ADB|nr:hypothetical protein [Kordiimonas aquimaris]
MAKQSYTSRLQERPQSEQKVIAIGFLTALVMFAIFGILSPLFSWYSKMNTTHDQLAFIGQKYAQTSARSEAQIREISANVQIASASDLIYSNSEVSLSVAQFEGDLRSAIGRVGLSINKLLPGLPESSENLWLLPAMIEVAGHPSKFTELIYILENSPPLIRIDRVEILATGDDRQLGVLKARIHSFHMEKPSNG